MTALRFQIGGEHQTSTASLVYNISPVKKAHKARTCWYRRSFRLIDRYQVKEKYKQGMERNNIKKILYINAYSQIPVSYGSKLHIPPTNYHLLAAQQEPYKKSLTLKEDFFESFLERNQENGPLADK